MDARGGFYTVWKAGMAELRTAVFPLLAASSWELSRQADMRPGQVPQGRRFVGGQHDHAACRAVPGEHSLQ